MKRQNNKEVRGREIRGQETRIREARGKESKRIWHGFFFVSCFLSLCFFSEGAAQSQDQVCFAKKCINVEVVRKEEELHRGLQFRASLAPDSGMLFVFQKSWPYAFWMKDTLIPLDMIFIAADLRVAGVVENAEPQTDTQRQVGKPAQYVLEVNGGFAAAHGITAGTLVEFRNIE